MRLSLVTTVTACVVNLFMAVPVRAQPAKITEPTFELRIRSVNEWLERGEYVGAILGQADAAKQLRELAKALSTEKEGLEGIDLGKPIGAFAIHHGGTVSDNPVVGLLPIADEARFLRLLKDRLDIVPQQAEGIYTFGVTKLKEPLHFRFLDGYLYLSPNAEALKNPKGLLKPAAFFAADDGCLASALLRLDRMPKDLKNLFFGQFELRVNDQRRKAEENETPAQRKINALVQDGLVAMVKSAVDQGQNLGLQFRVEPRSEELSLELSFTAKAGTPLARSLADSAKGTSLPAAFLGDQPAVIRGVSRLGLPDDFRKRYAAVVDELIRDRLAELDAEQREPTRRIFDAIAPTLRAGNLDFAFALTAAAANRPHGLIAALKAEEVPAIVKLAKDFSAFVPGALANFDFDVETVGNFALHKIEAKAAPEEFKTLFGTRTLWLATSRDFLVASVEEDGRTLKKALKAEPRTSPLFDLEVALASLVTLTERQVKPAELREAIRTAFGKESPNGRDTLRVTIASGEQLKVKFSVKGQAVRLMTLIEEVKKKPKE